MNESLCAIVLSYNESLNIRACLESIAGYCPVCVVDSGSTDGTIEICREYTDQVLIHPYATHAAQWQWALNNACLERSWVLALDADFVVSDTLKHQIDKALTDSDPEIAGYYVRHDYRFGGGRIRYGGTKKFWLRLVQRERVLVDDSDLVDFRFVVNGKTGRLNAPVEEYNRRDDDISVWIAKQDKFSVRLAVEEELRHRQLLSWRGTPRLLGSTDQRFRWLRNRWASMPLFIRPVLYFLYRYLLAGGFLDGRAGLLYHSLQGFWLRMIVDWKISQIRTAQLSDKELLSMSRRMVETHSGQVRALIQDVRNLEQPSSQRQANTIL